MEWRLFEYARYQLFYSSDGENPSDEVLVRSDGFLPSDRYLPESLS